MGSKRAKWLVSMGPNWSEEGKRGQLWDRIHPRFLTLGTPRPRRSRLPQTGESFFRRSTGQDTPPVYVIQNPDTGQRATALHKLGVVCTSFEHSIR